MIGRIPLEDVKKAFSKTGLKPTQGVYLDKRCACGMGAIYAQKTGHRRSNSLDIRDKVMNLYGTDKAYIDGFEAGFDSQAVNYPLQSNYDYGKMDGLAAWDAVKGMNNELQ